MKRPLSPTDIARRDERRARFRALWKTVADLPEAERIAIAARFGLRTVQAHELSLSNTCLVWKQCPTATVVGGFRQWLKQGRAVRKGEHGLMIWIPIGIGTGKANGEPQTPQGEPNGDTDVRFIVGTIFDIAQTDEIEGAQ